MPFNLDSRRIGSIPSDEHFPDRPIQVLEVESPLNLDRPTSRIWPEFLPKLHGVIVCYDASLEGSFQPVQTLVRKCFLTSGAKYVAALLVPCFFLRGVSRSKSTNCRPVLQI
jgi:hypothetical protein